MIYKKADMKGYKCVQAKYNKVISSALLQNLLVYIKNIVIYFSVICSLYDSCMNATTVCDGLF